MAKLGWTFSTEYVDDDYSAYNRRRARPAYQRMLSALQRHEHDALVVYNIDRLYRLPRELEDLIDLCESGAVGFSTCGGEYDLSTSQGRLMARLMISIANTSSADTSRRVARSSLARAVNGNLHSEAYGHKAIREIGSKGQAIVTGYELHPHESAVIREVVRNILGGATPRSQALMLNARGDLTTPDKNHPDGGKWTNTSLRKLLLSVRLIGKREHTVGRTRDNTTGKIVDPGVRTLYDGNFPAIISAVDQAKLGARFGTTTEHVGRPACHLLGGIFVAPCGTSMQWHAGRNYICPGRPLGDNCTSLAADAAEAWVVEKVLSHAKPIVYTRQSDNGLAEKIANDEQSKSDLNAGVLARKISAADAMGMISALTARIESTKKELATADAVQADPFAAMPWPADSLRSIWEDNDDDFDWRRSVIRSMVERIDVKQVGKTGSVFNPRRLTIVWR